MANYRLIWDVEKRNCVIVGDSVLNEIDERQILKTYPVRVRFFPGAGIKDMYYYLIPILEKKSEDLILHDGTTNDADSSNQQIVNDLLAPKQFIKEKQQICNVILSMPTKHCDNQSESATVNLVNKQLSLLNIDMIEYKNTSDKDLGRHVLHLTNHGRVMQINNYSFMNFLNFK